MLFMLYYIILYFMMFIVMLRILKFEATPMEKVMIYTYEEINKKSKVQ